MFKTAVSRVKYVVSLACLTYAMVNAARGWYWIAKETKLALSEALARRNR